ncbi:Squalene/phytoene synthase [Coniella lustricola]|uniref:Squalene/phytoene synthase n=1 Tax=Coniella lustricola TaxID=2025994 RepID=A0A2T2ZYP9_9PEZI|nr:Squalene/phytoene synthase [Coniella lustricola]
MRNTAARPTVCHTSPATRRAIFTDADVENARKYCVNQLRQGDYDSYLIRQFVPRSAQNTYDALRTLNLELARLPETVSNPVIGQIRLQFWKDSVNKTFAGTPPREPISILLHKTITDLAQRTGSTTAASSIRFWLLRFISTREKHMDNRPFTSLAALEDYAEHTYSTLMYMTLASMGMRSVHMDHLASHIGKACGIVAVLRGVPILAAPPRPVQTPNDLQAANGRSQALLLPLDVMAEAGLREEDVFRHGPDAPGLQDAVFKVATRANDHLITAREMLDNVQQGRHPGHEYEHQGESQHMYEGIAEEDNTQVEMKRAFGVLLEGVPCSDYLERVEKTNFDPFKVQNSWKLPWRIWRALRQHRI